MAPKVVDKEQRRKDIATASSSLIYDIGIKKITVAQVAKAAGIGKGTIYEYFENKDDIIFEIINIHIEQYHNDFLETIKNVKSTKEKVFYFFKFVLDDDLENMKHFNGYKEYLSIVLSEDNDEMCEFNKSCTQFFDTQIKKIIQEGIDNKELIPQALALSEGLLIFEKGLALLKMTEKNYNTKESCELFINNLFDLIEIK